MPDRREHQKSHTPPVKDDAESLHLKPEPPLRDSQRTNVTTGPSAPGAPKDTAAISSSELESDTDGGTAAARDDGTGSRLYAALKRGATLGNYVILDKLGQGGMGTVFRAEHRRMLREVALKVLSPDVLKAPQAVQRFHREVRVTAKLSHPNIVTAYDADEEQGVHFLVMEIVEGTNLAAHVKQHGPLAVKKAVDYVVQAARGLDYAHSKGIVHRDIKPGNLMLDQFGFVKILDPGLARLDESGAAAMADITDTGNVMGTIDYLSPEQAFNTKLADQRSDIYSLGCTLWFLWAGKPIYGGQTPVERILAHRDRPVPLLRQLRNDVSMELEAVFRQMVAKSPDDRYQSMGEVLKAFERCHLGASGGVLSAPTAGFTIVAPMADDIHCWTTRTICSNRLSGEPHLSRRLRPAAGVFPFAEVKVAVEAEAEAKSEHLPQRRDKAARGSEEASRRCAAASRPSAKRRVALAVIASLVLLALVVSLIIWAINRSTGPSKVNDPPNRSDSPLPGGVSYPSDGK